MSIRLRCLLPVALATAACAHAADLKVTLETANLRLRKDAPIPLEVRFENPTPRLLEGRLEFTLLLGERKAGVHRSAELVIQPGTRTVPILLPPPPDAHPGDGIAARLRWLGTDGTKDLGEQRIGIHGIGADVVLGIVRTGRRLTEPDHARETSLKFESLRPALDAASWLSFTTHLAPIASNTLPTHPTGLCAYDAVLLDGPALSAMSEKQLTALARWAEAGGSVGICTDAALDDRHVAFLNRLAASEIPVIRFALDPNGSLMRDGAGSGVGKVPILLRPGLGRAFVATDAGSSPKAFDRNEWRAAVAWLWKLRDSEQREVARTGTWSKDFLRGNQGWRGPDEIELSSIWSAAAGFNALTPGAPRQMPLGVVALVLGTLLIVAGPADWFALGWLRRRRWTWIAFPLACAGFAWWTAHLAGRYLGVEDRSGRVRIVDLSGDGRPLRELRFEMLLPARDREWIHDVRDGIAVPVPRGLVSVPSGAPAPSVFAGGATLDADSVSEWPAPAHFILRRTLQQWAPAMVRITAFPESADGGPPNWDAALAHFDKGQTAQGWSPGASSGNAFAFEIPGSDASDWESNRYRTGFPQPDSLMKGGGDASFARWVAFGGGARILGGLGASGSPVLAGTADLIQSRERPPGRRVLCAWRRAGGELLIYRRSFPVQ